MTGALIVGSGYMSDNDGYEGELFPLVDLPDELWDSIFTKGMSEPTDLEYTLGIVTDEDLSGEDEEQESLDLDDIDAADSDDDVDNGDDDASITLHLIPGDGDADTSDFVLDQADFSSADADPLAPSDVDTTDLTDRSIDSAPDQNDPSGELW